MLSTGREFISFLFCWIVRYRPRMALCVRKKNDWRIKTVDFNWIGQQSGADGKAKCGFQLSRKQTVASFLLFSLSNYFLQFQPIFIAGRTTTATFKYFNSDCEQTTNGPNFPHFPFQIAFLSHKFYVYITFLHTSTRPETHSIRPSSHISRPNGDQNFPSPFKLSYTVIIWY